MIDIGTKVILEEWVTDFHSEYCRLGIHGENLARMKREPSRVVGWGDGGVGLFPGRYLLISAPGYSGFSIYIKRCYMREVI